MPQSQAQAVYERGLTHCRAREYAQAEPLLLAALALDDSISIAWHDLGGVFVKTRRFDLAERAIRRALALDPTFPESHFMLAGVLLALGAWPEGWSEFEWRFGCRQTTPVELPLPRWQGEHLTDKHVLLVADQGFGDTLQFVRCAPLLVERGARLSIWGPEPTTSLLARQPYFTHAETYIQNIPTPDYYVPLLSLPHLLGLTPATLPKPPYLQTDEEKTSIFSEQLGPRDGRLRVALTWAGSRLQRDNDSRSMPLAALAPLLERDDIRWISVQKGDARAELAPFADRIEDWSETLTNFDDTAAFYMALDGVVSVCSAPIHVAGALNVPSIALLSTEADWRWTAYDATTPWYPRTQLARQTTPGDWASLIPQVSHFLDRWHPATVIPTICEDIAAPEATPVDRHEWLFV